MEEKLRDVVLRFIPNGVKFPDTYLAEDVWLKTNVLNKRLGLDKTYTVLFKSPKDRYTDLASIPNIFSWLFNKLDWGMIVGGIGHDELWKNAGLQTEIHIYNKATGKLLRVDYTVFSFKETNNFLYEKARTFGYGIIKAYTVKLAVSIIGKPIYYKYLKRNKNDKN